MITYGHEKYIREAIEGVLMQECDFEVELIISNDNSPDNTDEVIRNIIATNPKSSWIKYIKQEKNLGMMPNFIFTMKECQGKYISFCEGDDYWTDPLKLQKQVDFLEANDEYVICFHKVEILKLSGNIVEDFITEIPENYETIETLARLGNYIHTPSVVFRNILKEFPFEFEHSPIGDYFLYLMLAEHGKLKYLEDSMAVYRYGIGIYSVESYTNRLVMLGKQYNCILSYLKDENLKRIILNRSILLLTSFDSGFCLKYTSNEYIIKHKSLKTILEILLRKIKRLTFK